MQILDRYGVWDTRAIAAHCVWTTEEDWALMAEKGVSCIHNPVSNLKLGSGVAWIPAMKRAGVNIALGTDGVSSNNNHDMFEEMKFAAILHNGVTHDPLALLPRPGAGHGQPGRCPGPGAEDRTDCPRLYRRPDPGGL